MKLRRAIALPMLLIVLSLAACGDEDSDTTTNEGTAGAPAGSEEAGNDEQARNASTPSGAAVRSAKVEIVDLAYEPDPVTIEAGGKVIWQNMDSAEHTATLDDGSFTTGALAEGKLKSKSFKEPGTFAYYCEIHPDMKGTVEVVEG